MGNMKNEFHIEHGRFNKFWDKSTDWFIRSWKYEPMTEEWMIARLKWKMYKRESIKHLKKALEYLNG